MAMPTVQEAAAKYGRNGGAAAADWAAGAARFQGDPTALAAAAGQKAVTNYQAAWASGRTQRALAAAGRTGWLNGINNPGAASAYTNGVQNKGQEKWARKMQNWWPTFENLQAQIGNMPKNTPQDSINRVAAWINGTIAAKQNL